MPPILRESWLIVRAKEIVLFWDRVEWMSPADILRRRIFAGPGVLGLFGLGRGCLGGGSGARLNRGTLAARARGIITAPEPIQNRRERDGAGSETRR
ncbi:MAG: hypothetical protein M2R46_03069 [Verrucomicrobia subdivision 3 bacterium]|nr:hypothetical protein [Limisphaerales bacterium]